MLNYRHAAINIATGEMINANKSNYLKRCVNQTEAFNRKYLKAKGQWRFCHDFGKKWLQEGYPTK